MKQIRLELTMSQAIEDDFLTDVDFAVPGIKYTQIADVAGRGYSVPKLGSAIWPQLNTMFIIYCTEEEAERVFSVVKGLRKRYADEGFACFKSEAEEM
ncbi:MAG: hypothetical protein Ta2A_10810 [Treponemataceae bacterium]|nr:MAG: hypothetical protein Ta2A_10810 [Treponemataceae bacterium]